MQERYDDIDLLAALIPVVRDIGRMPTYPELRIRRIQGDKSLPNDKVFTRLGNKTQLTALLLAYCREHPDCGDVEALLIDTEQPSQFARDDSKGSPDDVAEFGFVYLLKSRRFYKIGRTNSMGRRGYELAIQLPERAERVHVIETDDPPGIERYWHQRFADRRKNGEWFELTSADIKAFKRRKFM
jgi:hypothetical protein